MLIIPAIDLCDGQAVRLQQGDYEKKTIYSQDPAAVAKEFEAMGAKYLHVVDLDGAKAGSTANLDTIKKIRQEIHIPMQLGGGIRSAATVDMYLKMGVDRVILGTVAVDNQLFVSDMIQKHGSNRIVVGVDVRLGYVSTAGWLEDSKIEYLDFIDNLKNYGVEYLVVTDISRDGMLTSPNWDMYESISGINIIVSGGVANEDHIKKAHKYYGIIVGKAHYEKKVDIKKCIQKYQA